MKVRDLKKLLAVVPDDYDVHVRDINFGGPYKHCDLDENSFEVDKKNKAFLLSTDGNQQYLD